jgi:hypothetical protein
MDKNNVLSALFSVVEPKEVDIAIFYGNRKGNNDVDIFLVFKKEMPYGCFKNQKPLDITFIGKSHADLMIKNLDPLITEPLLTGTTIYGEDKAYKSKLRNSEPNPDVVRYLTEKAKTFYSWSEIFYPSGSYKETANNLRFTISYIIFASYYSKNNKVITFGELVRLHPNDLLAKAEKLTKGQFRKDELDRLIKDVSDLLAQTKPI